MKLILPVSVLHYVVGFNDYWQAVRDFKVSKLRKEMGYNAKLSSQITFGTKGGKNEIPKILLLIIQPPRYIPNFKVFF